VKNTELSQEDVTLEMHIESVHHAVDMLFGIQHGKTRRELMQVSGYLKRLRTPEALEIIKG